MVKSSDLQISMSNRPNHFQSLRINLAYTGGTGYGVGDSGETGTK